MNILALLGAFAVLFIIFLSWAMTRVEPGIDACNAVPTLKRRELKNATICFIPAGETVDTSVVVSATTWPDVDPTTNYTDYEIPDIEGLVEELTAEAEDFLLPRASGGYMNEPENHLRMLAWIATTSKTSSFLKKLQYALSAAAVASTAQTPGATGALYIDGVLLIELRGNAGAIIERVQIWARMTLTDPGAAAAATTSKLQVKWSMLSSALNTYVALGS
jgi:hypothetical protein